MIIKDAATKRELKKELIEKDLVIVGGGMSGVCGAITAARQGLRVLLVQDRPVLGGNASSEVRLWILGATSHMGNNNRWSREGGVIDEILVENTHRNPEGNPVILDMILLDKVTQEPNITLLLNTAVYEVMKTDADHISALKAFCSQNATEYELRAPLFCDASGDGIVGFLSGAAFRMGAENRETFNEPMAPDMSYGELLGHSLYFYTKDTGKPVAFHPPAFAMDVQKEIPRYRSFNAKEHGCKLWWVEYGGRLDTVHDTEQIKWELWKVIYGVWDYIKNSGEFPEAATYTLEWVGMIPGKRESRRFEGDYMLSQTDLIEQRIHPDAVAYGGWSIDLHPADGVFSERSPCNQWHSKGLFQIPYRCLYSRNIKNLFLAGRIISVSHVAFGATRVMATSAYTGQAVAVAAALCARLQKEPQELLEAPHMATLQKELMKTGQYIPGKKLRDEEDLALRSTVTASSSINFSGFDQRELMYKPLTISAGQLIPVTSGTLPAFRLPVRADAPTELTVEIRSSSRPGGFTPDKILFRKQLSLSAGDTVIEINSGLQLDRPQYLFLCFMKNEAVEIAYSAQRITGFVSVFNGVNKAVSNNGKQQAPEGSGVDTFEFWCPQRRPEGQNLALTFSDPVFVPGISALTNGVDRPTDQPNAWIADPADAHPSVSLDWSVPQQIRKIHLAFDTDFDHAMESVLMTHPETTMPFCVQRYQVEDEGGNIVYQKEANFQTQHTIVFEQPVTTKRLTIRMEHPSGQVPAALFSVRCYAE
ncbi:FAD-dependent oxidoreductase [Niabella beijingensis]|uniref:FAD-dependent oxidoreductase n=1 Tax=Niabella beijingensis TaxID=2872700 RepID=UPI001CC173B0|nr:FAD-dependent oxidoreductase [Niabella beijingensis]MBZ4189284.1 FAD-dependent oxidoreductase [Niabella beijingensis]